METSTTRPNPPATIGYPSLSDRVQSCFIDGIFIIVMMFVAANVLDRYDDPPGWVRAAVFVGLWGVYEPLCTTIGGTIGNNLKGIRVKRFENTGKKINFFQAFFRYLVKCLLGWLSFITIHSNPERRAIHDIAVGSVMVKVG